MRRLVKVAAAAALVAGAGAVVTTVVADACAVDVVVNSQTPQTGFESGGTAVRITGINFVTCGVTRVSFGGADGTGLTKTATTIDVIAPRGSGDVTPTLHYESESVVARTFTYVPVPVITRLRPAKGSTAGGTKVIVSGSGFAPPDGTSEVAFASDPASPDIVEPSIATSDELVVTSPPGAAGPADVTVIVTLSSGETAESNAESFTFVPAPIVTSITPDAGSAAGGDIVEIIGANFQRGVQVLMGKSDGSIEPLPDESRFGENSGAPVVQFIDDTTIRAITPSGVPGTSSIVVLNPDGQFGVLSDGYTYSGAFPTVTATTPETGLSLGGTEVEIVGTGFVDGATVEFGDGETRARATSVSVESGTLITATIPPNPPGSASITVTNPDRGSSTTPDAFTYDSSPAPTLTSISPTSAGSLGGAQMTLLGSGFNTGAVVRFGDLADTGVETAAAVIDGGQLTVTTPPQPPGTIDILVVNPDGQTSTAATLTITSDPAPTLATVAPATGPTAGATLITITGTGFSPDADVRVGGVRIRAEVDPDNGLLPLVRDDAGTSIVGLAPPGSSGNADVTVTNPDDAIATLTGAFTYTGPPPATLTSIVPNAGTSTGGTSVELTGMNFAAGSIITFGNADCSEATDPACNVRADSGDTTVVSANTIRTTTPAGLFGLVDVAVVGPDGTSTILPYGFDYGDGAAPPTIVAVDPANAQSDTTITIDGTGFAKAAQAFIGTKRLTEVTEGSGASTVRRPVVRDPQTIVGISPRSVAGTFPLSVANPDGQGVILLDGFTYPIDDAAPVTTASATAGIPPTAFEFGAGNWARTPVSVSFAAVDSGSGVDSITYSAAGGQELAATSSPGATATLNVTAQGRTTISFWATDVAGNVESPDTRVIDLDSVPPSVTATSTFVPGTQTNGNVDVVFECVDAGSGVIPNPIIASSATGFTTSGTNPLTVTLTDVGLGQSARATCTDIAGNTGTANYGGINITREGPTLTAVATTADGQPYTSGVWTDQNVIVTFVCRAPAVIAPPTSPQVASVTRPQIVVASVTNLSVDGSCTDSAGNVVSATFDGIFVDKRLPVMSVTASSGGTAYAAGQWTNRPVVVTFACTDDGIDQSGVATVSEPITISAEGSTAGAHGACTDVAGNQADPAVFLGPVLIDMTPPTCTVSMTPNPVRPPNGQFVGVVAAVRPTDDRSGVLDIVLTAVAGRASDVQGFVIGTESTAGSVRTAKGAVYTFTYVTNDLAGNASEPCATTVTVG